MTIDQQKLIERTRSFGTDGDAAKVRLLLEAGDTESADAVATQVEDDFWAEDKQFEMRFCP